MKIFKFHDEHDGNVAFVLADTKENARIKDLIVYKKDNVCEEHPVKVFAKIS